MNLSDHVRQFRDYDADYIAARGTKIKLAENYLAGMACHNATFIWLYRTKHGGKFPRLDDMLDGATQLFVDNLIKRGHPKRVTKSSAPLAGDVLIFADPRTTVGRHSCVVIGGGRTIAGYNQIGWLRDGKSHEYTEHKLSDIDWVARSYGLTPRRADVSGAERYIWAVREATAVSEIG